MSEHRPTSRKFSQISTINMPSDGKSSEVELPHRDPVPSLPFLTTQYTGYSKRDLHKSIVVVKVGAQQAEFFIHKELLCRHSEFFARATGESWNVNSSIVEVKMPEDREHWNVNSSIVEVKMPEDREHIFTVFEAWLYDRALFSNLKPESGDIDVALLADLYIFADRIECPYFQNAIIDRLCLLCDQCVKAKALPTARIIEHILENTAATSPLRQIMVDMYAYGASFRPEGDFMKTLEEFPAEFVYSVFRSASRWFNEQNWGRGNAPYIGDVACRYHIHVECTGNKCMD